MSETFEEEPRARVTLEGTSQHGKNRVREHGTDWEVIDRAKVQATGGEPGLFLKSVNTGDIRWVRMTGDPHFIVHEE